MPTTFLIFCLCCIASSCWAAHWRPTVGISPILGYPTETGQGIAVRDWHTRYPVGGMRVDAGLRSERHEFYVAYQRAHSPTVSDWDSYFVSLDSVTARSGTDAVWESRAEQRLLLGYRYWPQTEHSRFAPVFGLAVETGESRKKRRTYYRDEEVYFNPSVPGPAPDSIRVLHQYDYSTTDYSDFCLGGVGEMGVDMRVWRDLELLGLAAVHFDAVAFYYDFWNARCYSWDWLLTPTLALELRYTFGRP